MAVRANFYCEKCGRGFSKLYRWWGVWKTKIAKCPKCGKQVETTDGEEVMQ